MKDEPLRLTPKSLLVLKLISAGHSYAQIVDSHPELNYHDIFFAAEEAVWLDEKLGNAAETRPSGISAMEKAKQKHPRAYAPWTEAEDAELKTMHAAGRSAAEMAEHFQRQPSAIRSRLGKMGIG
jgi:hypothetical protein